MTNSSVVKFFDCGINKILLLQQWEVMILLFQKIQEDDH